MRGSNWIAVSAFAISFVIRLIALEQTHFANGWDAYFYLVQVQSVFDTGAMHSEEWTLFYPLLLSVASIFDYILSIKILSALLAASTTLALILIAKEHSKHYYLPLFIACWSLASPELTYFAAQWPKNLLGLTLLLYLILFLKKENYGLAIIFLILGLFGHRLTAILSIVYFAGWFAFDYLNLKLITVGLLSVSVLLTVLHFIPGVFSFHDLGRLSGLLNSTPIIPPIAFLKVFGQSKVDFSWQAELWILLFIIAIATALTIAAIIKGKISKFPMLTIGVTLAFWLPVYNYALDGAGYRFFHNGALLIPLLYCLLFDNLKLNKHSRKLILILSSILLVASSFTWRSYDPTLHDPPYNLFKKITEQVEDTWSAGKPELVIAHKALAEFFTYHTKVDAMPWLPEYKINRLYRMAHVPIPGMPDYYIPQGYVDLAGPYIYLEELQWQRFVKSLKVNESDEVVAEFGTWKNPANARPAYLLKN